MVDQRTTPMEWKKSNSSTTRNCNLYRRIKFRMGSILEWSNPNSQTMESAQTITTHQPFGIKSDLFHTAIIQDHNQPNSLDQD
ncbi:hypothetical protein RclHR1_08390011 [Rhizophagus clarus]|uniref:Uncharacterized protein n=1 Tax=Rhizophagus clarus TaxID=94130 RepID=A0A2Z6SN15_9GLOM|nr:hypothetical protein RclHR1_08390011 [Rhizophagus clarus]